MGIADDMKKIAEDIIASYDMRVKAIGALVKDTHKMLKGFQSEHKKMAADLKANLAKGEEDRLKDFKAMMNGIQKSIKEIETYVKKLLGEYTADMKKAANAWQGMSKTMAKARKERAIAPKVEAKVNVRPVKKAIKEVKE